MHARVNMHTDRIREKMSLDELHNAMFIINIYIYKIAYLIGLCEITPHHTHTHDTLQRHHYYRCRTKPSRNV